MTQLLDGKVALISGAARGQGAAHARRLAAEGATVLCGDILDDLTTSVADEIRRAGQQAQAVHLDVREPRDWSAAVALAEGSYGKLDILVNNAGVFSISDLDKTTDEEWARNISVNQTGPFYGTRAAIPAFRRAGGGAIVNTSSIFALMGVPGYVAYIASKAAVIGLTRTTAVEYGPEHIRANAICMSGVDTAMMAEEVELLKARDMDDYVEMYMARHPMNRVAAPEEISEVVLHLVSPSTSWVTGTVYVIDGGLTAA